jgi:hypothetical protein
MERNFKPRLGREAKSPNISQHSLIHAFRLCGAVRWLLTSGSLPKRRIFAGGKFSKKIAEGVGLLNVWRWIVQAISVLPQLELVAESCS